MMQSSGDKELNFELNLLPIFDILSVCICFLLMTVVWIEVASVNASQSIGSGQASGAAKPTLWVRTADNGEIEIEVQGSQKFGGKTKVKATSGVTDWKNLAMKLEKIHAGIPDLTTGIVVPNGSLEYASLIQIMDTFKEAGIRDVGISPL